MFWVVLSEVWPGWRSALVIVRPETVLRWHREGFQAYWRWRARSRGGRPRVDLETRQLIARMHRENPLWGAPRIHGELLVIAPSWDVIGKLAAIVVLRTVLNYFLQTEISRAASNDRAAAASPPGGLPRDLRAT